MKKTQLKALPMASLVYKKQQQKKGFNLHPLVIQSVKKISRRPSPRRVAAKAAFFASQGQRSREKSYYVRLVLLSAVAVVSPTRPTMLHGRRCFFSPSYPFYKIKAGNRPSISQALRTYRVQNGGPSLHAHALEDRQHGQSDVVKGRNAKVGPGPFF